MSRFLSGDDKLSAKFQSLTSKDAKAAYRKGTRAGAKVVQRKALQLVPRLTGRTALGIKVRAMKAGARNKGAVGTAVRGASYKGDGYVGAFQEFGWKVGPRRLGDARKQVEGKHYMQRAAEQSGQDALDAARQEIAAEIVRRAGA